MASRPHLNGSYLLDSCTVIDYQKVEALHILRSFATHCDSLRVSSLALAKEVRGLLRAEYEDLGVKILALLMLRVDSIPSDGSLEPRNRGNSGS